MQEGSGRAAENSARRSAVPGTVAGDLDKRVGDFVENRRSRGGGGAQFRGAERL
jgi:hypothetical protein